jgi:hypothetical protein
MRSNGWRCCVQATPAKSPWRAHVACALRLRQRQSFERMHTLCFGNIGRRITLSACHSSLLGRLGEALASLARRACGCASPFHTSCLDAIGRQHTALIVKRPKDDGYVGDGCTEFGIATAACAKTAGPCTSDVMLASCPSSQPRPSDSRVAAPVLRANAHKIFHSQNCCTYYCRYCQSQKPVEVQRPTTANLWATYLCQSRAEAHHTSTSQQPAWPPI